MDLIVILERTSMHPEVVQYVLRAAVPAARQSYYADPEKTSAYRDASVADLTALRAGQYLEHVDTMTVSNDPVPVLKSRLIGQQAAWQAAVTDDGVYNPFKYYGTRWDGATWTNVVVA